MGGTVQGNKKINPKNGSPSRCNSNQWAKCTQQAKGPFLLNKLSDFLILKYLECPKSVPHSLLYEWLRYLWPFGLGGTPKGKKL